MAHNRESGEGVVAALLRGYFREGSPYIDALISIPGLSTGHRIEFLIDTGADETILMPGDLAKLEIDYGQFKGRKRHIKGVGGFIEVKLQQMSLLFTEESGIMHFYGIDAVIMSEEGVSEQGIIDEAEEQRLPSPLGQNILSHWRLVHDPSEGKLSADVLWAGWTFNPSDGVSVSYSRSVP